MRIISAGEVVKRVLQLTLVQSVIAIFFMKSLLTLAEVNLETAKTSPINILADCQKMYDEISEDYANFKDKMMTIKLLKTFDSEVNNYDELLNKRKEINEILKYIKNQELLDMIMDTITKQYNTIIMEGQDINTFNDLVLEKARKLEALDEIDAENNSEEFQSVLKVLIENEKRKQAKIEEEQRKIVEEEKKRKLEIERKKQEEILKRQRTIEEARKKEMEKRTKKMLEEQQNSVLQGKKKGKGVSFEVIKDNSLENESLKKDTNIIDLEEVSNKYKLDLNASNNDESTNIDDLLHKNKIDIEKELFEEFNNESPSVTNQTKEVPIVADEIPQIDRELLDEEKPSKSSIETVNKEKDSDKIQFPDMSIDEYMKNFDENKVNTDNIFDSDMFPSIPM